MFFRSKCAAFCVAAAVAMSANGSSLDTLQGGRRIAACKSALPIAWESVPSQKAFVRLGSGYRPATKETSVQVVRTKGHLYVRMTMDEPDGNVFKDRERFTLWQNESVEVLLGTPDRRPRRAALHLAADPLGRLYAKESIESTEEPGV